MTIAQFDQRAFKLFNPEDDIREVSNLALNFSFSDLAVRIRRDEAAQ